MKSIVLGQSILVAVERFNSLMAQLPRVGAALVELELIEEGRRVMLPVSRRAFKAFDMGDGTVLLSPQGDFQLLWAVALGRRSLNSQDRRRLGKNLRRLEVLGLQGPGVTLPGLRFAQGPDPKEFRGPARKFLRAAERNGILGSIYVAEVGVPVHMLDRLGARFGLTGPQLAAAASLGDVLLVLRRMPLTDPVTGFVIALPVPVNSPGAGDVLYLHPDISLVLYGDQDGDRYYLDVASVDLKGEYKSVKAVRPTALFPYHLQLDQITTQIKMSGLNGAPALAGVLAAAGVGPLFHIVFRIAAAVKLAGYRSESLEVLSLLTRVLEPLFDARKRAAEARVVGEDEGEPVMGYSLPYLKAIVQALKSSRLHQASKILSGLAADLLSDKDEDAKAVGELVARAVQIMNRLPDISLEPSSYPELADVDVMAFGSADYLLDGDLVKPSRKPTIAEQSRSGKSEAAMMRELEIPSWCRLSDRELAHSVGGSEMELPLVWEGEDLDGAVQSVLSGIYRELLVANAPEFHQVPPQNEREKARFEEGEFWFIDSPESLAESRLDWAESNVKAPEEDGLVEDIGDKRIVMSPVYMEDGETVRVYHFPIKDDGEVISVDLTDKVQPEEFLSSSRLFHIGLGSLEKEGETWYRFHLLALAAEKVAGTTYSGKSFAARRYRIVSLYASPWFREEPEAVVSGMKVMSSFADRVEWLPGRIDTVADVSDYSIRVRNRYITPQASLVLALMSGVVWRALGVSGKPGSLGAMLRGDSIHPFGVEEALRVQRDVRSVVRRLASQALDLRNEYAINTAKHIIVFGDLIRAGMVYAGSDPDPDIAIHRFNKLVTSVAKKMFGSSRWYPRKGNQNRLILMDIGDDEHWSDMLAFGAQEWYRFVRETPAIKAVPSSINGKESVVQELTVAFVEAPGFIQPAEGSSETAFLSASSVDWVEKEVSELLPMPVDGDYTELVRAKLAELAQFGFTHLRGVDGGLVPIENVDDFEKSGVAHRIYEHSVTSDHIERSVQFWAVARTRPAGAKVVLLDGMVKSFAGVVDGEITTPVGKVDAVFSYISLRKKQAWGLMLNGLARVQGKPDLIDRVWAAYRDKISAGKSEQEAMLAAFAVARDAGLKFETVTVYVDGRRVGDALVVRVKGVFVDDVSVRDEDPDEAGFNGTVLFAAELVGVPYQRRFIDSRRAVEVSQALFGMMGKLDLPVLDPDPGPDAPDGDGKVRELELGEDLEDQEDQTDIVDLGALGDALKGEADDLEDEMAAYAALASTEEVGEATLVGLSDLSSVLSGLSGEDQSDDPDDDTDDDPDGEPGDDDPDAGGSACVLVVGTRRPTDSMVDACVQLVRRMVNLGCTVVSGGADGIDTIAVSTAVAEGGAAKVILPWPKRYSIEGAGSCQVFVQELGSPYAIQKRELVMSLHPAPHYLSESVIKLHMRNVEMIDMIREARGIVYAIPSWHGDEYSGGTGMAIRLCEYYGVPCFVYHPERGWYKHV